jgi:hypothetical protein
VAPADRAASGALAPGEDAWLARLAAAGWPADQPAVVAVDPLGSGVSEGEASQGGADLTAAALAALRGGTRPGGPAIVAVVDDAVGFLHRRFRRADGRSRFDAVWLMAPPVVPGGPRGRVIDRDGIHALAAAGCEASAYASVMAGLFPPQVPRGLMRATTHGTHVADLAAGATPGTMDGIDLLAACLPPLALRDTTGGAWEGDLILALHWIVGRALALSAACKAGPRPLVINLSLGMSAGPKDGTGRVQRAMAEALAVYEATCGGPARATLPFGNDHRTRQVALVAPAPGVPGSVGWQIPPDDRLGARMLVRAAGPVGLMLVPPGGGTGAAVDLAPGTTAEVMHRGRAVAVVRAHPAGPGLARSYDIAVLPTRRDGIGPVAPAGRWELSVLRDQAAADPLVSLQVQRGDTPPGQRPFGRQSSLVHPACHGFDPETRDWSHPGAGPVTRSGSHSALVTVQDRRVFAMAAAGARPAAPGRGPHLARYSAAGSADPAWTVRQGPDACAPSDASPNRPGVVAAGTRSGAAARLAGTSVAAPALARLLARELGPGGVLAGGGQPDEIGALLARPGAVAGAADPARAGRGWVPSGGARET